jgi:hypothetical protein
MGPARDRGAHRAHEDGLRLLDDVRVGHQAMRIERILRRDLPDNFRVLEKW